MTFAMRGPTLELKCPVSRVLVKKPAAQASSRFEYPMNSIKSFLVSVSVAALFSGCAGTDFQRPDPSSFHLGKSTTSDLIGVMGPASRTGKVLKNGLAISQLTYVYATKIGADPLYPGVTPARVMVFSTFNDTLVGEQFISSFKVDATDYDDTKIGAIIKGKTTRAEVVSALGPPSGEAIYPAVNGKGGAAIIYAYSQVKGGAFNLKFYSKVLTVSLNASDVVSDIDYVENGSK